MGAGRTDGALDASNMFKPALARGELQAIGATTLDEYRQHIEKDGALERRFQKVIIEPTNQEETVQILMNIKELIRPKLRFIINGVAFDEVESLLGELPKNRSKMRKKIKNIMRFQFNSTSKI